MGKWYVWTESGTRTFSISITIKVYLNYFKLVWIEPFGYVSLPYDKYLGTATLSHSVTIEIPY
ncbi:MAG: hypothetical protein ACFFAE_08075 [Candidatus Hodarchaeota archaeon]